MNNELDFFITTMPSSRIADYYLGCLEGAIFMDFDNCKNELIQLKRISFDGYGCCELSNQAIPMNETDSKMFKEIIKTSIPDQSRLTEIIKKTLSKNSIFIWNDALKEYGLL